MGTKMLKVEDLPLYQKNIEEVNVREIRYEMERRIRDINCEELGAVLEKAQEVREDTNGSKKDIFLTALISATRQKIKGDCSI